VRRRRRSSIKHPRSFEQMCINYCNEKLNNHFNEHVFKHELAIYQEEGVNVRDLSYKDNLPILEFLENPHNGIYSMMDEQIMINGTDEKFLGRVQQVTVMLKLKLKCSVLVCVLIV
jgi:myosin heavy subunit